MRRPFIRFFVVIAAIAGILLVFNVVSSDSDTARGQATSAIVTTGPGDNTICFVNGEELLTATDFKVVLLGVPPPAIGGGFGGTEFPVASFEVDAAGGGFLRVVYQAGAGGTGVPAGEKYNHSFPGWPVGTQFRVSFSYSPTEQAPILSEDCPISIGGETTPNVTSVGGVAGLLDESGSAPASDSAAGDTDRALTAAAIASAGLLSLAASAWYIRRRITR